MPLLRTFDFTFGKGASLCLLGLVAGLMVAPAQAQQGFFRDRIRQRIQQRMQEHSKQMDSQLPSVEQTLMVGGVQRTFRLYVPEKLRSTNAPIPLVMLFHGGGGSGGGAERAYGMDSVADKFGFAVAYPEGIGHHWNDGRSNADSGVDDVAFVNAILDRLIAEQKVDRNRIYACGMSNGAIFSNYLGLVLSNRIRAIASVAGAIPENDVRLSPEHPISVLLIHGTHDEFVPFNGGQTGRGMKGAIGGNVVSHKETLDKWLSYDGGSVHSSQSSIASDGRSVQGLRNVSVSTPASITIYATKSGATVEDVVIANGGHAWPGHVARALMGVDGATPMNFDASEMIARFFTDPTYKPR